MAAISWCWESLVEGRPFRIPVIDVQLIVRLPATGLGSVLLLEHILGLLVYRRNFASARQIAKASAGCLASRDVVAVGVERILGGFKKVDAVLRSRPAVSLNDLPARWSPATTAPRAGRSDRVRKDGQPARFATCMLAVVQVGGHG
jgi:hypothetical protein